MSKALLSLVNIPFSKRFVFLSLLAVFVILGNVSLPSFQKVSGQSGTQSCSTCSQPTQRTIYAPTIGLPEALGSDIVLNCRSTEVKQVMPTFYTASGEAITGAVFQMQPNEMRFVTVESLIPEEHRNRHIWGGMSLSYVGSLMEMWAQITLRGGAQDGSADVVFSVLNGAGSDTQEAVWRQLRPGAAVIALGNSSNAPIQTRLQFSNGETQEVDIAPFATRYVRRNSNRGNSSGLGESVKLTTTGPAGSLKATGFVISNDRRYTSGIRFYDTLNTVQPHLFATNFRVKNSSSQLLIKNTSTGSVTTQPRFRPLQGDGSAVELPAVTLAAGEIKELDLQPLRAAAASRSDLDSVSVQIENNGLPGSLIGALYSTNQTTGVFYDVPLRDSGQVRNSTGAYPIRLDDDYKTVVSITNVGNETAQFRAVIRHIGGQYTFSPRELEVGQTATFDIKQIRDEQTPDQNGNTIPVAMTSGQFGWSLIRTPNTARLIGRSEVVSRWQRVSSSYSCPICCLDSGPIRDMPAFVVESGSFTNTNINETWYDCYLNSVNYPAVYSSLYTASASIATVEMESSGLMRSDGFNAGETMWYSQPYYVWDYQIIGYDYCEDWGSYQTASGPVEVRPTVTNVASDNQAIKISQANVSGNQSFIHFVTPKGAANSQVTLTATLSQSSQQILNDISWEGATESASNPLQATVLKSSASKNVVKIKYQGNTIKELRVWVVWATITSTDIPITYTEPTTVSLNPYSLGARIAGGYDFTHTIQPSTIVTDPNRPNFSGINVNPPPGGNHPIFGTPLSGGVNAKWDNSRQMRLKVINPAGIDPLSRPLFPNIPNYPTNEAEGNDDRGTGDPEQNDPYSTGGTITGTDTVGFSVGHIVGAENDTYELRLHFREFTRLEIEGLWYKISDFYLWRIHLKFKKVSGKWINDGTNKALDNTGF